MAGLSPGVVSILPTIPDCCPASGNTQRPVQALVQFQMVVHLAFKLAVQGEPGIMIPDPKIACLTVHMWHSRRNNFGDSG